MGWPRLGVGFVVGTVAGTVLGRAVYEEQPLLWQIGALTLSLGILITLSVFLRPRGPESELGPAAGWDERGAPLLGEMLVSYGLISEGHVARALALQQKNNKRLGQVLVEMGLVTHAEVAEVLEEQLSRREGRLLWKAEGRPAEQ